jgi:heterodisulfide reductase subunit A
VTDRIGVFLCECGPNIKEAVGLGQVVRFVQGLEAVAVAERVPLLCSNEGKALIKERIREQNLTRIVIAACSPKEHESTFRQVLSEAGLNPFLLQIADIREQCAWVTEDQTAATGKAKAMLAGAVRRVTLHKPLEVEQIPCRSDVLVVGSGIAGISAALALAQEDRRVYLVERLPAIGGKAARYGDVFPNLECASCLLDPILDEALHNKQITVLTLSEVEEVSGFFGNFLVKLKQKARLVDLQTCIGCGACFDGCPVTVTNEYNEGMDTRKAVYIPFAGALPNAAVIDRERCLHFQSGACAACEEACPFGSINFHEEEQVHELTVGAVVLATGFDLFDAKRAPQYGYGTVDNVYSSLEFERLLSQTGPTGGKIRLKSGAAPHRMVFVHCVGSRSPQFHEYCSSVCCRYSLKFAHQAREQLPEASLFELYSDFCLPGVDSQRFLNRISEQAHVETIQMKGPDSIEITQDEDQIRIRYTDVLGKEGGLYCDMVVLAPAIEGARQARDLAGTFDLSIGDGGFISSEPGALSPVLTIREGIFVAGCAQGPMNIQDSATQGQAAAAHVLVRLVPGGTLSLEPCAGEIREDLCCDCGICMGLCPHKAIGRDETDGRLRINRVLCKGCGICAVACASGAIEARHFTDLQISSEIEGMMKAG